MTRDLFRFNTIAITIALAAGCLHSAPKGPTTPGLETYSDGTSRLVAAFTTALYSRDRAKLEQLCQPEYTLIPATEPAAPPFVSPSKLRVERFVAATVSSSESAADPSRPSSNPPLSGETARAFLLERRETFGGIIRDEARIGGVDRLGDRRTLHVHTAIAGVDSTHARMQEESWWTWTLQRRPEVPEGWAIESAIEERRTLVTAPGPIFRQVYPEEGNDRPWRPGTSASPTLRKTGFPGEIDTGGAAVLQDCFDRGPCVLVAGGAGIAALTRGNPDEGGPFKDRAELLYLKAVQAEAKSILTADFNNDGMPDLFVSYQDAPCRLYIGRRYLEDIGNGGESSRIQHLGFEDVTEASGLGGLTGSYRTAIGFDADRDGWLDLYVVQYGDAEKTVPSKDGRNGLPNRFFRNVTETGGPMKFVDETVSSATGDTGWGLSAAAADYDADGRTDIFVANAFGRQVLLRNITEPKGPIRFADLSKALGTAGEALGTGAAWGDYDLDGDPDLFVSGYWLDERWALGDSRFPSGGSSAGKMIRRSIGGNLLLRNDFTQSGSFVDVSESAQVARGGWSWGTVWADVDGDGRPDLLVASGLLSGTKNEAQAPVLPTPGRHEIDFWGALAGGGRKLESATDIEVSGITGPQPNRLYLNLGDGTFSEVGWTAGFDTSADLRGLVVADITGDGAPDVMGAAFHDAPVIFENANMSGLAYARVRVDGTTSNWDGVGAIVRLTAGGRTQVREVTAGGSFLSDSGRVLTFGLAPANSIDSIEVAWPSGRRSSLTSPRPNRRGLIEITEPPPPELAAPVPGASGP